MFLASSMNQQQATKFAKSLLDVNCDEPEFEVAIEPSDLPLVAGALRDMGCSIDVIESKSWLRVRCPERPVSRAR
jgi:hypothetical protein